MMISTGSEPLSLGTIGGGEEELDVLTFPETNGNATLVVTVEDPLSAGFFSTNSGRTWARWIAGAAQVTITAQFTKGDTLRFKFMDNAPDKPFTRIYAALWD